MRWFVLLIIFFAGVAGGAYIYRTVTEPQIPTERFEGAAASPTVSAAPSGTVSTRLQTFFVPYWQLDGRQIQFPSVEFTGDAEHRAVYFGVAVNQDGVQQEEPGYQSLSLFNEKLPEGIAKYVGVRMTNHSQNLDILDNPEAQSRIVEDVVALAANRQFDGIVVDLEFAPTLNGNLPSQINRFIESFQKAAHQKSLKLAMTIYGDTFYRRRPYDIAYLSKIVDEMMIMAYDFHKVSGEPGPNFPLRGRREFGYDMETMTADFAGVSADKLTVIFGMYGYDWTVDEQKRPVKPATSNTLAQIRNKFLENCAGTNCIRTRHKQAAETEVEFVDGAKYHSVWFEDLESASQKAAFLRSRGIRSLAFWAYGYF